jgi:transcriptional regulator with XRE-family HTH domain
MISDGKIGKRIRLARIANGFSQEDLGDALSVTRSAVSLWEKGRSEPEEQNLQLLSEVLKVSIGYLTRGEGKPPVRKSLPDTGYRRDMISRMHRLIETGRFDNLIETRMERLIRSGEFDDRLTALGYARKRR